MQAKRFMLTNINISSLLTAPLKLTIHLLVDFQKDVKTFYRLRAFGANEKINHRSLLQSNFRTLKPLFFFSASFPLHNRNLFNGWVFGFEITARGYLIVLWEHFYPSMHGTVSVYMEIQIIGLI